MNQTNKVCRSFGVIKPFSARMSKRMTAAINAFQAIVDTWAVGDVSAPGRERSEERRMDVRKEAELEKSAG